MIGVIGGSGLYGLDDLKVITLSINNFSRLPHQVIETVNPETPWGFPSAPGIVLAETSGKPLFQPNNAFLESFYITVRF